MAGEVAARTQTEIRITDQDPGPQGFLLKSLLLRDGRQAVVAAGSDSQGTNYALMRLRQLLAESDSGYSLPSPIDLRDRPAYGFRGIYLHQHWRYNYPYAAWSWGVEDWKHGPSRGAINVERANRAAALH